MEEKKVLTIEDVKNCIGFEKGSGLHTSLSGMCDCWYKIEKMKPEGATDEEAAKVCLEKLGIKMLELSKI